MAPKRKSDAMDVPSITVLPDSDPVTGKENENPDASFAPIFKKARVADASKDASTSKPKGKGKPKAVAAPAYKSWQDVELDRDNDPEGSVPVYDDCNEIRRKIRLLQKTPNWKVTHWLQAIGGINSNSYGRFMKDTGPTGGATNGTYYAAYVYFEKVRIMEGKKKTAKRERNEIQFPGGMSLTERRMYVWGPA